jgi:hypothetical protein
MRRISTKVSVEVHSVEPPQHIYFAHSMRHYGKQISARALTRIREEFPDAVIHDPETMGAEYVEAQRRGIPLTKVYRRILNRCVANNGGVVLTEYHGTVGRGVYEEVVIALTELNIPVWVLDGETLHRVSGAKITNHGNWVRYAQVVRS